MNRFGYTDPYLGLPYRRAEGCRSCGGVLETVFDLGPGPLKISTFPVWGEKVPDAPLILCRCVSCTLLQLQHTVNPDLLYRQQYWYRSSVNEVMRAELTDLAEAAYRQVEKRLVASDVIIDIGANDGFLLGCFNRLTPASMKVGFEPASNLREALRSHADVIIPDFFADVVQVHKSSLAGRAKIITAVAMIYDVHELPSFFGGVREALHPDGVVVVQFQDLKQMIDATAFDNICHEHLTYFSLRSFEEAAARGGLVIVHAELRAINGGSLRITLKHHGARPQPQAADRIATLLAKERACEDWASLEEFVWRVGEVKQHIRALVEETNRKLGPIDLYAASTKANTLLQVCQFGPEEIRYAWERSREKVGRFTVTGIPIVAEEEGRRDPPAALLVGAWQFKEAFIAREAEFLASGGVMLVPLPVAEVVMDRRVAR